MLDKRMKKVFETFIATASEKNRDVLLEKLLSDALEIANCDAGTLYLLNDNKLDFYAVITKSMGIKKIGENDLNIFPSVKMDLSSACAYCVIKNEVVNIADVYCSSVFDFSGPKNYDKVTNYKTKSMIVIPMKNNKDEHIGVMQLLNAQDENGNIISFSEDVATILSAIASQAAIRLTNMNYTLEVKKLMESIVETIAEVIYLRTPYNVSHTHNMARYATNFMKWLNEHQEFGMYFSDDDKELFLMSVWLHDIGKLITPLEIMDKATRLSAKFERVMTRLDIISLTIKYRCLKNGIDPTKEIQELENVRDFINYINNVSYLNEENSVKVLELSKKTYEDENGKILPWFTEDEIADLSIVRGTLTLEERVVMQNHVKYTEQILNKMNFNNEFKNVPKWANSHHEYLNGTGYPNNLTADDLDIQTRLLTIIDVFDGLSANDRPYKKATPIDKTFEIMNEMVNEGKLDGRLLSLYIKSKVWEIKE